MFPSPENSPFQIALKEKSLTARWREPWAVTSWAPLHGGDILTTALLNQQLGRDETCGDRHRLFRESISRFGLPQNTVCFLTAADVSKFQQTLLAAGPFWVHAVTTVGLSNARAAGDEADVLPKEAAAPVGTINLWVATNALPDLSGRLEAIHIASSAKTSMLQEMGVRSKKSGRPAAGTGTDCIAVVASGEKNENYCGMHTLLGEMIGKAVGSVIRLGVEAVNNR